MRKVLLGLSDPYSLNWGERSYCIIRSCGWIASSPSYLHSRRDLGAADERSHTISFRLVRAPKGCVFSSPSALNPFRFPTKKR